MAKRIVMIPPFDVLTGNLSGKQELKYAENNNPAYEAPNGTQGARNYVARYIGAKRSDGKTYFAVRRKNTAVLNGKTRMQLALTGATAAIISTLKSNGVYAQILAAWDHIQTTTYSLPDGVDTPYKWALYNIRDMLRYYKANWSFNQAAISFTIKNPFNLQDADALVIKQSIWIKFASVLAYSKVSNVSVVGGVDWFVDGVKFFAPYINQTGTLGAFQDIGNVGNNHNYSTSLNGLILSNPDETQPITYNGLPVYLGSTQIACEDIVVAGAKYATVQA